MAVRQDAKEAEAQWGVDRMKEMLPAQQQKKTGAQGEAHAGRSEILIATPRISLPGETQTSPAALSHLIWKHLLSPANGYKEKCLANLP